MININEEFNRLKSIVCINGEIPIKDHFVRYSHLPIFAADGAANTLIDMGIYPSMIIGDLDSITKDNIPIDIDILYVSEQESTDLQKVLNVVEAKELFPCLIYGATGKEIDHTLHNLAIIENYSRLYKIIFHDSAYKDKEKYGIFVSDYACGSLKIGSKVSVWSFAKSNASASGLTWDFRNKNISPKESSIRNSINAEKFEIEVNDGTILILFDF